MNNAHYRISLDVHSAESQVQLICRRGETGRQIRAALTRRGRPYGVAAGCVAEFAAKLPDGTILKNACGIADNTLIYPLTQRTTEQSGVLECEMRVMDEEGNLLISPRFTLAVYDTVYNSGDAVIQEGPSAQTVKSSEPGFSQVFLWSDGNPMGENRLGYFVSADMHRSAAMITAADGTAPVLGVTTAIPGFAAAAGADRYDSSGKLSPGYQYVTMLGFAPVRDLGRCAVNGYCRPDKNGMAEPAVDGGFYVAQRIDQQTVTVLLTADADLRIYTDRGLAQCQNKLDWVTRQDIDQMLSGTYEGYEDETPAPADGILLVLKEENL